VASERPFARPASTLTDRELEVLRLVGAGKTNREIAFLLNISAKTVQHHVAHAYDKLGI
jgi:DNA-binding NarL/FixJ family response regulator